MDSPLQSYGFKYWSVLLAGLYFKTFRAICNSQFAQKHVSILLIFHTLEKDTAGSAVSFSQICGYRRTLSRVTSSSSGVTFTVRQVE